MRTHRIDRCGFSKRLAFCALMLAGLLATTSCGTQSKTGSGCSSAGDCPATQVCNAGICTTATAGDTRGEDVGHDTTSVPDATSELDTTDADASVEPDDTSEADLPPNDSGSEGSCFPGEIRCLDGSYQTCDSGVWSATTPCATTSCAGFQDVPDTGLNPPLCETGVGCLLTTCEPCAGALMVEPTGPACRTTCLDGSGTPNDAFCWPGYRCTSSGTCELTPSKKALGQGCSSADECDSGFCSPTSDANGVRDPNNKICCSKACDGTCRFCNLNGSCRPTKKGTADPACTKSSELCGTTGLCDGAGTCALRPDETVCEKPSCTMDNGTAVLTAPGVCQAGACVPGSTKSCPATWVCKNTTCVGVSCTGHTDCSATTDAFCRADPQTPGTGDCSAKLGVGKRCDTLAVDGDDDQACLSGRCLSDPDNDPESICFPANGCIRRGKGYKLGQSSCADDDSFALTCTPNGWTKKSDCGGSPCQPTDGEPGSGYISPGCSDVTGCNTTCEPCTGGFLAGAKGCLTRCGIDAQCQSGYFCTGTKTKPGVCKEKQADGEPCKANDNCVSGHCVEGPQDGSSICCSNDCSGNCEFCGKSDGVWSCRPRKKGEKDAFCTAQATSDPICGISVCSGQAGSCIKPGKSVPCGDGQETCKTGGEKAGIVGKRCDGDGNCKSVPLYTCETTFCDGDKCGSGCTKTSDCPSPSTQFCAANGLCLDRLPDGSACDTKLTNLVPTDAACLSNACRRDSTAGNNRWFCAPAGQCVKELSNGYVAFVPSGYKLCASDEKLPNNLGIKVYTCGNGGVWSVSGCAVSTISGYKGCGDPGPTGYHAGVQSVICSSGSSDIDGCKLSKCLECGHYYQKDGALELCNGASCNDGTSDRQELCRGKYDICIDSACVPTY